MGEKRKIRDGSTIRIAHIDRGDWARAISDIAEDVRSIKRGAISLVYIEIEGECTLESFTEAHVVMLSCLVGLLSGKGIRIILNCTDNPLQEFLISEISFYEFFNDDSKEHIDAADTRILNVWQVQKNRVTSHSESTVKYLKNVYFKGKDLSGFKNCIDELFANVADHAQANGVAYSFIRYCDETKFLRFAICDLGRGIAASLRAAKKDTYKNDKDALLDATKSGITAGSRPHNRGFGLDNVISNIKKNCELRIISNGGFLYCKGEKEIFRAFQLPFCFSGTLIYLDLDVTQFEEDEDLFDDLLDGVI